MKQNGQMDQEPHKNSRSQFRSKAQLYAYFQKKSQNQIFELMMILQKVFDYYIWYRRVQQQAMDNQQPIQKIEQDQRQKERSEYKKDNVLFSNQTQTQVLGKGHVFEQERKVQQGDAQEQEEVKYNPHITINQDSSNQMLTMILEPGEVMWYRGQIIAANRPYSNQENINNLIDNVDIQRLLHYLKLRGNITMKLNNAGPDLAYFSIRKRNGGGKILYLDYKTYRQNFNFDFSKLLVINVDPIEYQLSSITHIPYLSKLKFKQPSGLNGPLPTTFSKISLALQSNSGNIIYQKSLGFGEKLYIGNSQVIAMSEQILIQKHDNQTVLMGPGLVFLQAPNSLSVQVNQYNQNFVFGILITMFFMLITIQQLIY